MKRNGRGDTEVSVKITCDEEEKSWFKEAFVRP